MAAISRAQELHQLLPGLNALFGEEYNRYEDEHEAIYTTENSERSFEEELKLSGFGAAPVKIIGFVDGPDSEVGDAYTDVLVMFNAGHQLLNTTGIG